MKKSIQKDGSHPLLDIDGIFMYSVHQFWGVMQKRLEHVLVKHKGLSFSQFLVMVGFYSKECPHVTQAKLADHLMLTEATVSRHINGLVAKKLLRKEKDADNKKTYTLTLTENGERAFMDAKKIIAEELSASFSHIKDMDKKNIMELFFSTVTLLQQKK